MSARKIKSIEVLVVGGRVLTHRNIESFEEYSHLIKITRKNGDTTTYMLRNVLVYSIFYLEN